MLDQDLILVEHNAVVSLTKKVRSHTLTHLSLAEPSARPNPEQPQPQKLNPCHIYSDQLLNREVSQPCL